LNYNDLIDQVFDIEAKAISALKETVNKEILNKIIEKIINLKGNVIMVGLGTSSAAARKISHSLNCAEIPAFFMSAGDAAHGGLGLVKKHDLVVFISKGGKTEEILNILPAVKNRKAFTVAVCEDENSPIAQECDLVLKVKVEREACPHNMLATASTLAVISVFDAIAVSIMKAKNITYEKFLLIHPHGAVGKRLKNTVKRND